MPKLLVHFPGRRYHATPWGSHVNEGLIEWPPSPWRLLRALLATGYQTDLWNKDGPLDIGQSLIYKLASVLPRYRLPCVIGTHSRHYMPLGKFKNHREETTLRFDTWAQVMGGVLAIIWDVELSKEESDLLEGLAERLGYLGRSESWITARLARSSEISLNDYNCYPSDAVPAPGWQQVSVMAPMIPTEYDKWRRSIIESGPESLPVLDGTRKKPGKQAKKMSHSVEKFMEFYPPDLISCLKIETSWLHERKWSQPPGSRRVFYHCTSDALESAAPYLHFNAPPTAPVESMLLSINTSSRNDHALPPITHTLPQAELLHRALVKLVAGKNMDFSKVLIGRGKDRKPLRGRHEHAHILPLDLDEDGHLDHFLIWASMGLDASAQEAVRTLRQTYTKGRGDPLRLALAGSGSIQEMRSLPGKYGKGLRSVLGPIEGSPAWTTQTPFVPPRHLKKRGKNTIEGQLNAELASRGLPEPVSVWLIDPHKEIRCLRHRHFIRARTQGPKPPIDCGFSIGLRFSEPVKGPISLGYASHFGLGLFIAESQSPGF